MSEDRDAEITAAVDRAKQGDADAMRVIYERYRSEVLGYVRSFVADPHEAEDITQQVFLKLMTSIGCYERRSVPFSAWLRRVARNLALDHIRRRRAARDSVARAPSMSDACAWERSHCLSDALDALPEDQRAVVLMRHVVGLTPPEIAGRMGRSEGSVHALHHRGRVALKADLRDMAMGPAAASARGA